MKRCLYFPRGGQRLLAGAALLIAAGCTSVQTTEPSKLTGDESGGPIKQFLAQQQARDSDALLEAARVREVLNRWIAAQGGAKRLGRLKNLQCLLSMREGYTKNLFRTAETSDGRYRYDLVVTEGKLCGGYDGTDGWQDRGRWGAGIYHKVRGEPLWTYWCLHALELDRLFPVRKRLADEVLDGKSYAVLELAKAEGSPDRWYFDSSTGLLARVVKEYGNTQAQVSYAYGDYRRIAGVLVPYEIRVSRGGSEASVCSAVRVEANATLTDVNFSPSKQLVDNWDRIEGVLTKGVSLTWPSQGTHQTRLTHAKILLPTTGVETDVTIYRRTPDKVLVEKNAVGMGRTVSGFNGTVGWENSEILGYHVLKPTEVNDLMTISFLGTDPYLRDRFPLRGWEGDANVDGVAASAVSLRNFGDLNGKFYFAKDDGRLLRVEVEENPATHQQAIKVDYSDYRKIGDLYLPFRVSYKNAAADTLITCSSVELDVSMPDSLFEPRTDSE